jgi:hypothetical protein
MLLPLLITLGGCWDSVSIADQAPVIALGVTPVSSTQYQWTFEIPNPTLTVSALTNLGAHAMYYSVQVDAPSFAEALAQAQMNLSRHVFLGQLQVVAWSPKLSAGEVRALLTALNDDGTVAKTYWALVTPNPAALLRTTGQSISEPVPGYYLANLFSCTRCQSVSLGVRGWRAWSRSVSPGFSLWVPFADPKAHTEQLAVYGAEGPPTIWSAQATLGWAYLTGHVTDRTVAVKLPTGSAVVATTGVVHREQVVVRNSRLQVRESVEVGGRVLQASPGLTLTLPTTAAISHVVAHHIVHYCLQAIQEARRTARDPFGFSRTALWAADDWPTSPGGSDVLPLGAVSVRVHVRLTSEGLMP